MYVTCLDLEGVLVPEIWIAFAEASGIPELKRTTRDEPDYDKLMAFRLDTLAEHGLGLPEIQRTIASIDPLPGAREFLDELRDVYKRQSIAICAAGAMGLPLAVADYRERKVFKRMKATPASPALILGVSLAIYALYAAVSLALLWAVATLAFGVQMRGSWPAFLGGWLLTLAGMLSICLLYTSRCV